MSKYKVLSKRERGMIKIKQEEMTISLVEPFLQHVGGSKRGGLQVDRC